MNENEKRRAQAEALRSTQSSGADRTGFWAGLIKYLGAAAQHEHKAAQADERDQRP
jgi:hypothetical protein